MEKKEQKKHHDVHTMTRTQTDVAFVFKVNELPREKVFRRIPLRRKSKKKKHFSTIRRFSLPAFYLRWFCNFSFFHGRISFSLLRTLSHTTSPSIIFLMDRGVFDRNIYKKNFFHLIWITWIFWWRAKKCQ